MVSLITLGSEVCLATTVHDPIHTALNVAQQVTGQIQQHGYHSEDIAKYGQMIQNQVEQINHLTTMINQNVEQLRRFGDPAYYTNMLGLDTLLNEVNQIKNGVGKTVFEVEQAANGVSALKDTGQGLYRDLSQLPDKFGQKIRFDTNQFKRFGAVQDTITGYNNQVADLNKSIANLENEVTSTTTRINSAGSLVETEKLKAKLQTAQATLDAGMHRAMLGALNVIVQSEANRNAEERDKEAQRQKRAQEMQAECETLTRAGASLLSAEQ